MLGLHLDLGKIRAYGSAYLASILYQTELGDFVYQKDDSSNMVLSNQASLGYPYDGLTYSGRGIELGATNDVDIPIHHTLGAEVLTTVSSAVINGDETTTYTRLTANSFNLAVTVAGTNSIRPSLDCTGEIVAGNTYKIYFNATVNSGTPIISRIYNGTTTVTINHAITDGENVIEFTCDTTYFATVIYFDGRNLFDISVTDFSVKQITNPNSYLTYYDFTDGLVAVDNSLNTPSTKYTLNTKTVNNVITHTTAWSASDWTRINNNPNLIGKLALETTGATKTIPELDMVMDAGASPDKWFSCMEME